MGKVVGKFVRNLESFLIEAFPHVHRLMLLYCDKKDRSGEQLLLSTDRDGPHHSAAAEKLGVLRTGAGGDLKDDDVTQGCSSSVMNVTKLMNDAQHCSATSEPNNNDLTTNREEILISSDILRGVRRLLLFAAVIWWSTLHFQLMQCLEGDCSAFRESVESILFVENYRQIFPRMAVVAGTAFGLSSALKFVARSARILVERMGILFNSTDAGVPEAQQAERLRFVSGKSKAH